MPSWVSLVLLTVNNGEPWPPSAGNRAGELSVAWRSRPPPNPGGGNYSGSWSEQFEPSNHRACGSPFAPFAPQRCPCRPLPGIGLFVSMPRRWRPCPHGLSDQVVNCPSNHRAADHFLRLGLSLGAVVSSLSP